MKEKAETTPKKLRLDKPRAMAEGYLAFNEGQEKFPNPYGRTDEGSEWSRGWEEARLVKEKADNDSYR